VRLKEEIGIFNRPHPGKEMDKGAVKSGRRFLMNAGFYPEQAKI
jgi:hypothetical protein